MDGLQNLIDLLPEPLEWRSLQCACRWRSSEPLLAKVHEEPRLRRLRHAICQKLSGLPRDDLLGERVRCAELDHGELRFFVELLKAKPRSCRGEDLDLRDSFPWLRASQALALGCWLPYCRRLFLAECGGLLLGQGLCDVLKAAGNKLRLKWPGVWRSTQ